MTDVVASAPEIAWAAGLYEGEGSVSVHRPGKSGSPAPQLKIGMTDEDVVRRVCGIVGLGKVYGPYQPPPAGPGRKPLWVWVVTSWDNVEAVWALFAPWLGIRRGEQFLRVLAHRPLSLPTSEPCGTDPAVPSSAGFKRHRRRGEAACADCRVAVALQNRSYYVPIGQR